MIEAADSDKEIETRKFFISEQEFETIVKALPPDVPSKKIQLLQLILEEWCEVDLPQHYEGTRPTSATTLKLLKTVHDASHALRLSLEQCNKDPAAWMLEYFIFDARKTPRFKDNIKAFNAEYLQWAKLLSEIEQSAGTAQTELMQRKGFDDKKFGYLIMLDLAAIYKFITGKKPTRSVHRFTHKENSPFYFFTRITWPMITNNGHDGFSAAWDDWVKKAKPNKVTSPLISNIFMRIGNGA